MYLLILLVAAIPFILPIASWVSARRTRRHVQALEQALADYRFELRLLSEKIDRLAPERRSEPVSEPSAPGTAVTVTPAPESAEWRRYPGVPEPVSAKAPPAPVVPGVPPFEPVASGPQGTEVLEPVVAAPAAPEPPLVSGPVLEPVPGAPAGAAEQPRGTGWSFDLESLVGVKLFSAIAGIALVIAAIFFLRYSIEAGWLQPPVRVAIGILVSIGLLVTCELKAARRYPATANALDAAAVAILFATFFAAHTLWALISAGTAFVLMAAVTAIAVWLAIRRASFFIAVLGLLGGFATPALLSSGENQPVPLFAYLALLNVGLAWVAYRKNWPVLTVLTVVFTTLYQWGWVLTFLDRAQVTLAMGIFLVFPVLSIAGLVLGGRRHGAEASRTDRLFERTALVAAGLPLLFAVYLGTVPAYGIDPVLLFRFLLLVDAGLLAVAIARREPLLHVAGAAVTLLTLGVWLASSYTSAASATILVYTVIFVMFFLAAPLVAGRFAVGLGEAEYASALALFTLPALARIEPRFVEPAPLFGTLLALLLLVAWRAIAGSRGGVYFVAAFFSVLTQAVWSAFRLDSGRVAEAIAVYAVFGVVSVAVPTVARLVGRPLAPRHGSGAVLIASVALLVYLSGDGVAPPATWGLGLLLAILNAALFVESAAGALPLLSIVGSLVSWGVLARWWIAAAHGVGLPRALVVVTGLALIMLAGFGWSVRSAADGETAGAPPRTPAPRFRDGLYLALVPYLFLFAIAVSPRLSLPPWAWFASLAVLTGAAGAVSRWTGVRALQVAASTASAAVICAWAVAMSPSHWADVAIVASFVVSAFALVWVYLDDARTPAFVGATCALLLGEVTAMATASSGAAFALVLAAHVINLGLLLVLATTARWWSLVPWLVVPAWGAVGTQWALAAETGRWSQLLAVSVAVYAVFIGYPVVLRDRARPLRHPYIAAILASVVLFLGGKAAIERLPLEPIVGLLPLVEAAVMGVLLRQVARSQPAGERDLGRLAMVAGAALAFVTVAVPLQLEKQWITLGWALEGAALAWLYRRIPHRGLLAWSGALMAAVFVRLAANPAVFQYAPRGNQRIVNWYLYTYLVSAAAFLLGAWWFSETDDLIRSTRVRLSRLLAAGGVILLFVLLNIEIADFYATGPDVVFRFGESVSQDLTYTIGWLAFGIALLAACIYLRSHAGRVAAIALIAVTTFKCFLYDLSSLEGLHRVGSFVGLAMALALVSLAIQKYVLARRV